MNILGLDPGSRHCGYAVIKRVSFGKNILLAAGLIKIKQKELQDCLLELNEGLESVMADLKDEINQVAIEDIFYAHNPQSVLRLAQFRGAMALKILQCYGNFYSYTALQVKKTITGKAKADKEQVAFMVKRLLSLSKDIRPLDITDAMAVALTHSFTAK